METFTNAQKIRLTELGADAGQLNKEFPDKQTREKYFKQAERAAVGNNRRVLKELLAAEHQTKLCSLEKTLADCLTGQGFTQVTLPTIIPAKFLDRMSIDGNHALRDQVFWLDEKSCLRPMLAPNLYEVSRKLINIGGTPLRIFEIGSCFRKESEGKKHLKEFTMLNLVEWGTPEEEREDRIREFGELVLNAAGIRDYQIKTDVSVVYGEGLDFVGTDGLELASSSMGPHPLDAAWRISSSWTGIGFGLERLLMYREKHGGIHRYGRSVTYMDGACLNIK